jgi:putative spermidine/putrescine transport system ATP-binding protein/spermidine/putrescine transport system ATP-binding protein
MTAAPVLELAGIEKRFGPVAAVDRLDLAVAAGEFFSLLGPSGSGKTTLLRIIAGLETPDRGRVVIGGRDVTRLPPYERGIGMVFQDFLLFPHKTVAENICFPLKMQNRTKAQQREHLDWVLRLVHLEGLEARYPHQLSGGQKQRVALARGLVARPALLLLDEPLANLDRELRKEMEVEVRRFQVELGMPFVYVTHNQEEALTMSDRMAVMHRGRLEQVGPKLEVYAKPATRFVASFVGAPNRLHGCIAAVTGAQAALQCNGVEIRIALPAGAAVGASVDYFLKSERIQVVPGHRAAAAGRNALHGILRDSIFKGQYADYLVTAGAGLELVASGPPDLAGIGKNQPVTLSWPPEAGDAFLAVPGEAP